MRDRDRSFNLNWNEVINKVKWCQSMWKVHEGPLSFQNYPHPCDSTTVCMVNSWSWLKPLIILKLLLHNWKVFWGWDSLIWRLLLNISFLFNPPIKLIFFCICQSRRQSSLDHLSLHNLMLRPIYRFPQILALLQVSNELLYLAVNKMFSITVL